MRGAASLRHIAQITGKSHLFDRHGVALPLPLAGEGRVGVPRSQTVLWRGFPTRIASHDAIRPPPQAGEVKQAVPSVFDLDRGFLDHRAHLSGQDRGMLSKMTLTRPGMRSLIAGAPKARCRAEPWAFYKLREDGIVPVICPTCQIVLAPNARCQRPPCYFAWGCFRYFAIPRLRRVVAAGNDCRSRTASGSGRRRGSARNRTGARPRSPACRRSGTAWPWRACRRLRRGRVRLFGRLSWHSTSRSGSENPRRRAASPIHRAAGRRHWSRSRPS